MSHVEFSLYTLPLYTLQTKTTSTRFWDRCLQGKTFLVQTVVDQWGGSFTFDPGDLIFHWNLYFYLYFFDQLIYSLLSRQWPSWSSLSEGPWPVHRLNKDWFLLISSIIARFSCFKELVRWSFKTLVELWPVCPCSSSSHTQSRGLIPQTDERFFIEKNKSCTHIVLPQIWKVTLYRTMVFV